MADLIIAVNLKASIGIQFLIQYFYTCVYELEESHQHMFLCTHIDFEGSCTQQEASLGVRRSAPCVHNTAHSFSPSTWIMFILLKLDFWDWRSLILDCGIRHPQSNISLQLPYEPKHAKRVGRGQLLYTAGKHGTGSKCMQVHKGRQAGRQTPGTHTWAKLWMQSYLWACVNGCRGCNIAWRHLE